MTKILVVGHAQHGKDTFAQLLAQNLGLRSPISSSQLACDLFLFEILRSKYGMAYETPKIAWEDRGHFRSLWFDEICLYNEKDPSRLCRQILEHSDIHTGIRSRAEYEASKHLFDLIIWVDRAQHCMLESKESMQLTEEDGQVVVDNNGSLDDLGVAAREFCKRKVTLLAQVINGHDKQYNSLCTTSH
jgi:hypothetical protein